MSPRSASSVLTSKVKLGGNATTAPGPVGRTSSAETDVTLRAEILSYSRSRGLFAGISLSGSTLRPDNGANNKLYGKEVSAKAIGFNHGVPAPACAKGLLTTLEKASPINVRRINSSWLAKVAQTIVLHPNTSRPLPPLNSPGLVLAGSPRTITPKNLQNYPMPLNAPRGA